MRIAADENIPLVDSFFSEFGEIRRLDGRNLTSDQLLDIDILLVRSVTRVNEALLAGTSVKFVGTATIGTDHVDLDYLQQENIGFASAPGCNAQAVVDYVLSAISVLVDVRGIVFADLSVGIIGVGNVGLCLRRRLEEMGVTVVATDPFKEAADVGPLSSLEEVLQADIVSLHTPLVRDGEFPTYHLIGAEQLDQMKPDACLINSSRGAVVNNTELLAHLRGHGDFEAILDVWEKEPDLDIALMHRCMLATPHIAGYSLDGKMRGTEMIYQAVCDFLGLPIRRKLAQFLPEPGIRRVNFSDQVPLNQALRTAIRASYEIRVDDGKMRSAMSRAENVKQTFDRLRRDYPLRRDIPTMKVGVPAKCVDLQQLLASAGFAVRTK
ncbi:4-phosphoerythronate dehydrogenase PdxB [Oceanobacter sp. 5_MG-2023]|uniref:4-phosphoerythronate dehydrogenase PdxB n=1 Tax=Oceanobacter sp. 5_MG-2023 TaxID=3062645 RepID=UPI0026E2355F|nr:4-phosphoerythronate dehydrogenase PdxB [Oceanobacter sp. 5_MG-2023]MDO6683329.1 4-phosphoerythronate dehydrogenase PdxB [Oceanobacter sp. 5_MG-2023]